MNTRGILAMIAAMCFFTATDSLMKLATATLPPSEIIGVRGVIATAMMFAYLRAQGPVGSLRDLMRPQMLRRTCFEIFFITSYVVALSREEAFANLVDFIGVGVLTRIIGLGS